MRSSQVYKILLSLDGKAHNSFERFLQSPYFNPRQDVIDLFRYFKVEIRKTRPKLHKHEVYKYLYPNEEFDDQKSRLLYSKLHQNLKTFLFVQEVSSDSTRINDSIASAYFKIGQADLFLKTIKRNRKELDKKPLRNSIYYRSLLDLEQLEYDYISEQTRSSENNLQDLTDTLDIYYFANKLKQACLIIGHQAVYKKDYNTSSLEHLLDYMSRHPDIIDRHPAIGVYYYCYEAMTKEDSEDIFLKFRNLLESEKEKFHHEELRMIYILAINYCIKRLNSGESKYVRVGFQLYKAGVENAYLLTHNILSQFTYKNAVALGLGLGEFTWVENFIYDFKDKLDVKIKETIFTFNLAKLKQAQKKYDEAMALLIHFNSSDILMNLAAKTNLLKMYYELNEFNSLDSLLQSMAVYLDRKKVLSYHKKHYKNIIRFTRKMIKLPPYAKAQKDKLISEIEQAEMRSEKEWFLKVLGA